MLTAISLRCAIESPKPSQSCLKKAVCLQKGLVHAVRHWLDLDETQLDSHILIFPKDLRWKKKSFVSYKVLQWSHSQKKKGIAVKYIHFS